MLNNDNKPLNSDLSVDLSGIHKSSRVLHSEVRTFRQATEVRLTAWVQKSLWRLLCMKKNYLEKYARPCSLLSCLVSSRPVLQCLHVLLQAIEHAWVCCRQPHQHSRNKVSGGRGCPVCETGPLPSHVAMLSKLVLCEWSDGKKYFTTKAKRLVYQSRNRSAGIKGYNRAHRRACAWVLSWDLRVVGQVWCMCCLCVPAYPLTVMVYVSTITQI